MSHKSNSGFTLVELAISMIIIGLLIGGILKGQELVDSARARRLVSDLKTVEAATLAFYDSYKGMPGDMARATTRLPNCTAENFCMNGDGNGFVASTGGDDFNWRNVIVGRATHYMESIQFWKQLAGVGLMGGINVGANPNNAVFGSTHPAAAYGEGGFEFYYDQRMGLFTSGGHIIRMTSGNALQRGPIEAGLTPMQASKIDIMMDDGFPNTGSIVMNYGSMADDCKQGGPRATDPSSYLPSGAQTCVLFFKFLKW